MRRGVASFIIAGILWFASMAIGSPSLRMLSVGFAILPIIAWLWLHVARPRIDVARRLSLPVVSVGQPVEVRLDVRSRGTRPAPYVHLDDAVPPSMGPSVRLCLEGVPGGAGRRAIYEVVPTMRGRMKIGPATVRIGDPFLLSRVTTRLEASDALIVTPAVEPLSGSPESGRRGAYGAAATRRSRGQSEEFAAIRPYVDGEDLRRVHWPSVARSGELMLRQDEARQGSGTTIFLDTRTANLGRSGDPAFERAVSAAASLALHLHRGTALHLATPDRAAITVGAHDLLIALASIEHTDTPAPGTDQLAASGDPTVIAVLAPPAPEELGAMVRAGSRAAVRIACLIVPPVGSTHGARAHERIDRARVTLRAAGWTVIELDQTASLGERWTNALRPHATSA